MKKNHLFSFFCALMFAFTAFTSCDMDDDPASDPRDAYVGTYFISANYICSDCYGYYGASNYTGTIVVKKGSGANELVFSDTYNSNHSATLNGSNFNFDNFQASGGIGSGGGSFGSNSISYNLGISIGITCTVCTEEGSGTK